MLIIEKEEIIKKLKEILEEHETMKNSYFFTPPDSAGGRRSYEKKHSREIEFAYNGNNILIVQKTQCSCKNIYYSIEYYINDEKTKKDIRFIKKVISELERK